MTRNRSLLVTTTFLAQLFVCLPASAGIDVRPGPDPRDPRIVFEGEIQKPGNVEHSSPIVTKKECSNMLCRPLRCRIEASGKTYCFGMGAGPKTDARPKVTPGQILTATRTIGLPSLKINIQPGTATLINFDTIFYARTRPFARSVTLLGYDIDLAATPVGYTWHHGDGTSHTTGEPGAPYPSKAVTYRYMQTAKHLSPSVDVTYRVRYRVDGGSWQTLSQTLTANGPAGDLEVKEAGAVLTSY